MPRKRNHHVGGQDVTSADVRRWVQSVGARVSTGRFWGYVRDYRVVEKIAAEKAAGTFEHTVQTAAQYSGVKVRAARKPGTLARFRLLQAANDSAFTPTD